MDELADLQITTLPTKGKTEKKEEKPAEVKKQQPVQDDEEEAMYEETTFEPASKKPAAKSSEADGPQQSKKESKPKVVPKQEEEDDLEAWEEQTVDAKEQVAAKDAMNAKLMDAQEFDKPTMQPWDTAFIFMGFDYLFFDFQSNSWNIGDVQQINGYSSFYISQDSSIALVDPIDHKCNHTNFIVSGGVTQSGELVNTTFGCGFDSLNQLNLAPNNEKMLKEMDRMTQSQLQLINLKVLPVARMMHQSCIVFNGQQRPQLLLMGGKVGNQQSTSAFTDSVISLDLLFTFAPYLALKIKDNDEASQWKTCAKMNTRRACFAHLVLDNKVYVFGGLAGNSTVKKQEHHPTMATVNAERYDPVTNVWENFEIPNIPALAAFAWTPLGKGSSEIIILGGTDGDVLQDGMWHVDFKAKTATPSKFQFDQSFAMNKLIYRKDQNMLYSIGGYGSDGQNFVLKMESGEEWEELERSHIPLMPSVFSAQGQNPHELCHYPHVFYN